ncbi:MAG: EAL domain-containing protein [Sulfurimicrobium sp.]|nr:EAL domain-containing protein [Sulfurimicrobium sp.]
MLDLTPFFISPPESSVLYTGNYDPVLVSLSVFVAILASYASLLVSQHVSTAIRESTRRLWVAFGGLCLGIGIWAMHFVGMLAFSLPCSTSYNATLTMLSTIPSILASILAIQIISRRELSRLQLATGGLLIGAGIGAMHYAGMAAMSLNGLIRYDAKLFLLSILVAIALATFALWIKFRLQLLRSRWNMGVTIASAVVMGLAVSGMHYIAMLAAYFIREGDITIEPGISPTFLAAIVLTATSLIVVVTIVATYIGRPNLLSFGRSYKLIGLLIAGWIGIAWLNADYYYGRLASNLYQQESRLARQQVEQIASNIDESIQLLKGLSVMASRDADIRRALLRFGPDREPSVLSYEKRKQNWTEDKMLGELNETLAIMVTHLKADDIYIVNAAGDCVAASNAAKPTSFVGSNYAHRDYFLQARAGQHGHQYAVGRTSRIPGLYYSAPLFDKGRFLGAVVVKRDIARFSHWTNQANAFISDTNGVIILAPDKRLEFRSLPNASVSALSMEKKRLQYKQSTFKPLEIAPWGDERFSSAVVIEGSNQPVVLASKSLSGDAINVYVPRPLSELVRLDSERNWLFILLSAAGSLLIISASAVVLYLRETQKAKEDLRIAATAFESQEGMLITDSRSVILRVNRAFTDITGYSAEEAVGQSPSLLKSGHHDTAFYDALWESVQLTGMWRGEIWNRRKNGEVYPEWLTITAVKNPDGATTHYVATLNDITSRKLAEDEIRRLAFYDPLTQQPNRRLLMDRLQQALVSSARSKLFGALFFIDLDNFKTLNDTLGHDVGDLLLKQVAQRLVDCVREGDTVSRLGGDEFVLMFEDLGDSPEEAANLAEGIGEKIIAALNQPYRLAGHEHHSTPSIGVTLFDDQSETVDELLKRADLAMYQAKAAGRNTLRFFDPRMQAVVSARAAMEADLRHGLQNNEFFLHYQPLVDRDGRTTGAEALLRWQHPRQGLVSPAEFIPLAEESGLILPLGAWVLEAACAQLVAWSGRAETASLTLAVNMSARQFRQPDFVDQVVAVLDRTGVNPCKLKLELTESLLLDNVEEIIVKMSALKAKGVGFSLDDFGTGYSSLSYLKRLPLDQLKIDRSFVRDVLTDPNDAAIARTIVALGQSLGLEVIAEGVENEAQRAFLASQGCHAYQGYLFSRPLVLEAFEMRIKSS